MPSIRHHLWLAALILTLSGCATRGFVRDQIVAAQEVPPGTVLLWAPTTRRSAFPAGWQACDGTKGTLRINNVFLRMVNEAAHAGETGGSATHTHEASTGGPNLVRTKQDGESEAQVAAAEHTHSITVEAASNLPPFLSLVALCRPAPTAPAGGR